jgi:glycosyltransferase involved in cell wall biosynthesis
MAAAEHRSGVGVSLNVLVIDRSPPASFMQGSSLIGRHVFRRLSKRHRLTLLSPVDDAAGPGAGALDGLFADTRLVPIGSPVMTIRGWLEAEMALRAPALAPDDARRFAAAARLVARQGDFDLVHVRQLPMAPYGRVFGYVPRVLELVDSETLGARRTARAAVAHDRTSQGTVRALARAAAARLVESRAIGGYGVVTTVADADAAAIRALAPRAAVEVIPNGVDTSHFQPLDVPEEANTLTFVGAMDYPPNVAAAVYLVEDVMPRLRTTGVRVRLVGRSPGPIVRALSRRPCVDVTGEVDDVRPWLSSSSLVVCPMVSGSGIKNKVLEALAMARPIVATPLALEGIDDATGFVATGNEAGGLAGEIDRLLADPAARREMGARGRALVLERYSWDACADAYEHLYERLVSVVAMERRSAKAPSPAIR